MVLSTNVENDFLIVTTQSGSRYKLLNPKEDFKKFIEENIPNFTYTDTIPVNMHQEILKAGLGMA